MPEDRKEQPKLDQIAVPGKHLFHAVVLDDDILYLREDLVFAFEPQLRWENGHIPGSRAKLRMVQFRGAGAVAFRTRKPLIAVKLSAPGVLYIDAAAIGQPHRFYCARTP